MIPGHHAPLLQPGEGRELAETARRAQRADGRLATALDRPGPRHAAPSARYLDDLDHRPELPRELERRLVAAARAGDARSRSRLVEGFLPLIASEARRYAGAPGADRLELTQAGVVGVLRALERADPERGEPFWPEARWWARQAMDRLVSEIGTAVLLSDASLRRLSRLRAAHGEPPADPLPEGEYRRVLDAIEADGLLPLLAALSDRERTVLQVRFGLEGEPAQDRRRVGERLGLSPERVRRIERHALGKLAAAAGAGRERR